MAANSLKLLVKIAWLFWKWMNDFSITTCRLVSYEQWVVRKQAHEKGACCTPSGRGVSWECSRHRACQDMVFRIFITSMQVTLLPQLCCCLLKLDYNTFFEFIRWCIFRPSICYVTKACVCLKVQQLLKVVKTNFVVMKLLEGGHKADDPSRPQFDFTTHPCFPIIKI